MITLHDYQKRIESLNNLINSLPSSAWADGGRADCLQREYDNLLEEYRKARLKLIKDNNNDKD